MDSRKPEKEIAEWSYRNPNGLQPYIPFPEDYISPENLRYNVPPIPVGSIFPLNAKLMPWHGYTGAKGFFNEQAMPYCASKYLINDNEEGCNVIIEQCRQLQHHECNKSTARRRKLLNFSAK